jgi:hypothetical protein
MRVLAVARGKLRRRAKARSGYDPRRAPARAWQGRPKGKGVAGDGSGQRSGQRKKVMADLQGVTDAGYPVSLWWSTAEYDELGRLVLLSVDAAPRPLR